jgi:hypothetical protein
VIRSLLLSFVLLAPLFGQVPDKIDIPLDGKPFATFHSGVVEGRPYLAPLRSASGKIITRRFPMEMIEGESRDHRHHRGLWFSYDDVNGVKFWENDPGGASDDDVPRYACSANHRFRHHSDGS